MSKILDTNDLLEAAAVLPDALRELHARNIEAAVGLLASALAEHLNVRLREVSDQGSGFGGLCATFEPSSTGQPCPEVLHDGDPGGDWE